MKPPREWDWDAIFAAAFFGGLFLFGNALGVLFARLMAYIVVKEAKP